MTEETRIYSTGEMPVNPIIRDKVYFIKDLRREPDNEEHPEVMNWSYIYDGEPLSLQAYITVLREENTELREDIAGLKEEIKELDAALFELDGGQ